MTDERITRIVKAKRVVACSFAVFVALCTALSFSPTLRNAFLTWDDSASIVENPQIRRLGWETVRWSFTTFHMGPYQPLSWLSLALDYQMWGLDPRGFHVTSVFWQMANALSLFLLCRYVMEKAARTSWILSLAAAFSAIVFALHPLRVESVAWATERRDLVNGFFVILSVWAYLHVGAESWRARRTRRWLLAAWVLFAASLLAKGTSVGLPLVFSVLDVYPLQRLSGSITVWFRSDQRVIWYEKVPFWILSVVASIAAIWGQLAAGAMHGLESMGPIDRVGVAAYSAIFYLGKALVPVRLSPLYEMPQDLEAWRITFLFCGLALFGISIAAVWYRRRAPAALAAWIIYLVLLAPVSGLLHSGPQIAADRYTYLPFLSLSVLTGVIWLSIDRVDRRHVASMWAPSALAAVALIFGVLTWRQCTRWRDDETLWRYAIAINSDSSIACSNLGAAWAERNRPIAARHWLERAVQLRPTNSQAHSNLGVVLRRLGELDLALKHHLEAVHLAPHRPDIIYNLARFYQEQGTWEPAATWYERLLAIRPDHLKAMNNLGICWKQLGRYDDAIRQYERAMRLDPADLAAQYNLAILLAEKGAVNEAILHYQEILRQRPEHSAASNNLAVLYERQGRYHEARRVLTVALERSPDHPNLLHQLSWTLSSAPDETVRNAPRALALAQRLSEQPQSRIRALDAMAAAWARLGKFGQAIEAARQAAELARDAELTELAGQIDQRIELYRTGKPFQLENAVQMDPVDTSITPDPGN